MRNSTLATRSDRRFGYPSGFDGAVAGKLKKGARGLIGDEGDNTHASPGYFTTAVLCKVTYSSL